MGGAGVGAAAVGTSAVQADSTAATAPSTTTTPRRNASMPLRQVLTEERVHLVPTIHGCLLPVQRQVVIEKSMPGTVVAVEHVRLAELLELRLVLIDLGWAGRHIVVAEQAEDRDIQV